MLNYNSARAKEQQKSFPKKERRTLKTKFTKNLTFILALVMMFSAIVPTSAAAQLTEFESIEYVEAHSVSNF